MPLSGGDHADQRFASVPDGAQPPAAVLNSNP
jgi:hypothetical protein